MQQVLRPVEVSESRIKELVTEQYPEMLYLFEKQPKRLNAQEVSYRKFLKEQVLKTLQITV